MVATDSHKESALGSTMESMMSLTVVVVRYSGCGAEPEQAAATRSELKIRSNQWKVRILMPFLQKAVRWFINRLSVRTARQGDHRLPSFEFPHFAFFAA